MQEARPDVRAVYIVLSHRDPSQVERLVEAVLASSPTAAVVVRHDARMSDTPSFHGGRVHVTGHRRPTDWGSWEIVAETIAAMRVAQEQFDPDLVALLSGQDYPVLNLAQWEQSFIAGGGGWVGTARPLVYRAKWGRPQGQGDDDLTRYTYRWFRLPAALGGTTTPARILQRVLLKVGYYLEPAIDVRYVARGRGWHLGLRRLSTPFDTQSPCYKGSQWWAMDRRLLDQVLMRTDTDHLLRSTYRRSIVPDESYFQAVLCPLEDPSSEVPLTYVEWLIDEDAPRVLTLRDLDEVLASGSPFCRKVMAGESDGLMDRLDDLSAGLGCGSRV